MYILLHYVIWIDHIIISVHNKMLLTLIDAAACVVVMNVLEGV